MDEIPSPCLRVCRMDGATGFCMGCKRTLPEIAAWSNLSEPEKRHIVASLPGRAVLPSAHLLPDEPTP
jgi:hypothetical protein